MLTHSFILQRRKCQAGAGCWGGCWEQAWEAVGTRTKASAVRRGVAGPPKAPVGHGKGCISGSAEDALNFTRAFTNEPHLHADPSMAGENGDNRDISSQPPLGPSAGAGTEGGGCQDYLTRVLLHGAHRAAGNMEPSQVERWRGQAVRNAQGVGRSRRSDGVGGETSSREKAGKGILG